MSSTSRRLRFARDAIDAVVSVLEALPESDERNRLLGDAHGCKRTIDGWADEAPSVEEHERAMQGMLKLHIAAAKLARTARKQ